MPHQAPIAVPPGSVQVLRPADLAAVLHFVAGLDDRTRNQRFCGETTPAAAAAHYQALNWEAAVLLAWVAQGTIQGLCDIHVYDGHGGREAEIAFCLATACRGRGIGLLLLARAAEEAARCGALRSVIVLAGPDDAQAEAALALGGCVDPELGVAILHHRPEHDRAPPDTVQHAAADGRARPGRAWGRIAAMVFAITGGALLLGAAGEPAAPSGEPRPSTLAAADRHTQFHCSLQPSAGCTCSAEAGALSLPLEALLSLPAEAGPGLNQLQASWRRECGITTDQDTAP